MQNLTLVLFQSDLEFENWEQNKLHFNGMLKNYEPGSVVILPEMFATGFSMNPGKFAQTMQGDALQWMKENSGDKVICGSLSIAENGKFYNRFIWAENSEIKYVYDKKHLFWFGDESKHYTAGTKKILIEYRGWKIAPFVCYDLRFPVWCRNTENADLMLFVANWPEVRIKAWDTLLPARAVENQCFAVGLNRVGVDPEGIVYNGSSMVIDAKGNVLVHELDQGKAIKITLNKSEMIQFRKDFPVSNDADRFEII